MAHKAERGVFELRQGRALCVTCRADRIPEPGPDAEVGPGTLVAAVEGLGAESLARLRSVGAPLRLIVTRFRARAMGVQLAGQGRDGGSDIALPLGPEETPDSILGLAMDRSSALFGPRLSLGARAATRAESAALSLTRLGHLLPALVAVDAAPGEEPLAAWIRDGTVLDVPCEEAEAAGSGARIEITSVAEAPVPLAVDEHSRFIFFREGGGLLEHVAVLIRPREEWADPVPLRLHSACLTGDLFGSMRCDCGEQLRGSLEHFRERGGGVLLYLAHEGRGIGLGNKIRAYTLQEDGLDTIDADGVLGFGADERRYQAAVAILRHLQIGRVELLTNNPQKVRALEDAGIEVAARTPIYGGINRHNLRYVQTKLDRSGHWLMDMISRRAASD
jgi:GTP cyclohydrolase II